MQLWLCELGNDDLRLQWGWFHFNFVDDLRLACFNFDYVLHCGRRLLRHLDVVYESGVDGRWLVNYLHFRKIDVVVG